MFTGIMELKLEKNTELQHMEISNSDLYDIKAEKIISEINFIMRTYSDDLIYHYDWLDKLTLNKFEEIQKVFFNVIIFSNSGIICFFTNTFINC